jgi:hypothetical protein
LGGLLSDLMSDPELLGMPDEGFSADKLDLL